jgi:hypothetical protein
MVGRCRWVWQVAVGVAVVAGGCAALFVADGRHRGWIAPPALFAKLKQHWYESQESALYVERDKRLCDVAIDEWRNALIVVPGGRGFGMSRRGEVAKLSCHGGAATQYARVHNSLFVAAPDNSIRRFALAPGAARSLIEQFKAAGREDIRPLLMGRVDGPDVEPLRNLLYAEACGDHPESLPSP